MVKIFSILSLSLFSFYSCKNPPKDTSEYPVKSSVASSFNRIDDSKYLNTYENDTVEIVGHYVDCEGHTDYTEKWYVNSSNSNLNSLQNIKNLDVCKIAVDKVTFSGNGPIRELSYIDTRDSPLLDLIGKTYSVSDSPISRSIKDGFTDRLYFNPLQKRSGVFGEDYFLEYSTISWTSKIDEDSQNISINFSISTPELAQEVVEVLRDDSYRIAPREVSITFSSYVEKAKLVKISFKPTSPISLRGRDLSTDSDKKDSTKKVVGIVGTFEYSVPDNHNIEYCELFMGANKVPNQYYPNKTYSVSVDDLVGKGNPVYLSYSPSHTKKPATYTALVVSTCKRLGGRSPINTFFHLLIKNQAS